MYRIQLAKQSGGKAGKGCNKTSTVQVFNGSMLVKMFRFLMSNPDSLRKARAKAEAFVASQSTRET